MESFPPRDLRWIVLAAAIGLALLFFGLLLKACKGDPVVTSRASGAETQVRNHVDTIYRDRWDTVQVQSVKTRVLWRDRSRLVAQLDTVYLPDGSSRVDTALVAQPFRASIDTVSDSIRIRGLVAFPPLRLDSLRLERLARDMAIERTTTVTTTVEVGRPFLERLGEDALCVALGYGLRVLTEPRGRDPAAFSAGALRSGAPAPHSSPDLAPARAAARDPTLEVGLRIRF